MLVEVLAAAGITHLVQLQSAHCKRNLPSDASWAAGGAAQPFSHILLPAADVLGAGAVQNGRPSNTGKCIRVYLLAFAKQLSKRPPIPLSYCPGLQAVCRAKHCPQSMLGH